jgi:HK97 family phage portal protein
MHIFGLSITRAKQMPPSLASVDDRGGWFPLLREASPGAWQRNETLDVSTVLTYSAVFACVTLIAADIAKLSLRLVEQDTNGVWSESKSPAFSPVLRKPNNYQNIVKFVEQWIIAKLIHGNTYVLKERDNRGVVVRMYVLDSTRARPLVAPDGSVWYELKQDVLSGLEEGVIVAPAREIIHDTMVALYHPLVGVSPLTACGLAALQGMTIQNTSSKFFQNGSNPGGVLTAPGTIPQATADRLKIYWDTNFSGENHGKVAVLGDGLKFEKMGVNAVDSQLIEQLKWTGETVCTAYHVPAYMVGIGPPPPYANIEPLLQQYYSQCIQSLLTNFEKCLDDGLGILEPVNGTQYGTEFDVNDLIWMDTATKTKAALDSIGSGGMKPDEARKRYFGLGPVPGGDTPYMQQQYWPLSQLAARPTPSVPASPSGQSVTAPPSSADAGSGAPGPDQAQPQKESYLRGATLALMSLLTTSEART